MTKKAEEIIRYVRSILAFDRAELGVDELLGQLERDEPFRNNFTKLLQEFLPEEIESLCSMTDGPAIADAADQLHLLPNDQRFNLSDSQLKSIDPNDAIELLCTACVINDVNAVSKLVNERNVNLLDHNGQLPLTYAIGNNHYGCAKVLLDHNANPNLRQPNGQTPMHMCAISAATKAIFQLLCSYGGNVQKRNNDGQTVLELLVKFGRSEWNSRSRRTPE